MAAPLRQSCRTMSYIFSSTTSILRQMLSDNLHNMCRSCVSSRKEINCAQSDRIPIYCRQFSTNSYRVCHLSSKGGNCATPKSWKTSENRPFYATNDLFTSLSPFLQFKHVRRLISTQEYGHRKLSQDSSVGRDQDVDRGNKDASVTENIYTIPNLLTVSRIVLTPVIGVLVVQQSFPLALGLFTFAGVTDWLDGYIARNWKNQMSTFGTALDPLADKILVTVLTATLTMAHLLPVPLAILIIGRDALLIVAGFVLRYISLPPPFTLRRYFDGTIPTVQIKPSTLSKVNTSLQLSLVCLTLAAPVFNFVDHPALQCLWYITAATTLGSGIDYVINRNKYVKFLKT